MVAMARRSFRTRPSWPPGASRRAVASPASLARSVAAARGAAGDVAVAGACPLRADRTAAIKPAFGQECSPARVPARDELLVDTGSVMARCGFDDRDPVPLGMAVVVGVLDGQVLCATAAAG